MYKYIYINLFVNLYKNTWNENSNIPSFFPPKKRNKYHTIGIDIENSIIQTTQESNSKQDSGILKNHSD